MDTTASRRQDQNGIRDVWWYLTQFRELALHDQRRPVHDRCQEHRTAGTGELGDFLAEVLERPELAAVAAGGEPVPTDFVQPYGPQAGPDPAR